MVKWSLSSKSHHLSDEEGISRPVRVEKEIRPSHPSVGLIRSASGEPGTFHLSFLPLMVCGDTGTEGHRLANSLCPSLGASCPKG